MHHSEGNSSTRNERTFFSHRVTVFFSVSTRRVRPNKATENFFDKITIQQPFHISLIFWRLVEIESFCPSVSPIIIIFEFSFLLSPVFVAPRCSCRCCRLLLLIVVVVVRKSIKPHGTVSESIGIPLLYTIQQS